MYYVQYHMLHNDVIEISVQKVDYGLADPVVWGTGVGAVHLGPPGNTMRHM